MMRGSRTDEIFTLLFMVLAIAAVVCFFAVDNRTVFLILGGISVVIRLVQYALRFFR
jgi:hypothetical protein